MASVPGAAGIRRLYRPVKQKYSRRALASRASLEADGRWHSAGRPAVCLASSEVLAALEVPVHLGPVVPAAPFALPAGIASRGGGDRWLASCRSAAVGVPSVRSGSDFNVLLNAAHPKAPLARVVECRRYAFDVRSF